MNILVVSSSGLYNYYSSSFVHNQAKAYVAMGHRVRALVPLAIGKRYDGGARFSAPVTIDYQDGVEVCYVRNLSLSNFGNNFLNFNQRTALASIKLLWHWIFSDFKPDVIHVHTIAKGALGLYLKKRLGAPVVITTHGGDTNAAIEKENRESSREVIDRSDAIVAVSSACARKTMQLGIKTRLECILNGFVIENVQQIEKKPFHIVQVNALKPSKHTELTIQAVANLREKYPEIFLSVVGSGPERDALEVCCRGLKLDASKVQFEGHLPNECVMAEMAKATFFCMPSYPEGFGIVYLEAMASGCITIGTEGEGIAELIVHGENGFLVPPDDVDAIVRVMDWCLQNPAEAAEIAERGRQAALELTWEKNAKQYLKLFSSLIEK